VNRTLRRAGWKVVRIWEHELSRLPPSLRYGAARKAKGQRLKGKAQKHSTPHLASGHPLPGRGGEDAERLVRRIEKHLE